MKHIMSDERMKALRDDPDFRALVNALESQTPEQIESFYSHYEHSDYDQKEAKERGAEDGNSEV